MEKITFHRRILDALPLPPEGQRDEYQDVAAPELVLRVTSTGHKTFATRRKIDGRAVRVTLGTYKRPGDRDPTMTVEQARKAAARAKAAAVEGTNPNEIKRARRVEGMTVRQMLAAYTADNVRLKPGTGARYLAALSAVVPGWLDKPLRSITPDMVQAAHKKHGARSPASANGAMRVLRLLWNYATTHNPKNAPAIYGENPTLILSRRKEWYRIGRRKTIIKAHDLPAWWSGVEALRKSIQPAARDAADLLELLLYSGLRATEGRELAWLHVDLESAIPTLTVPDAKNRDPHVLPIPSQLLPMFKRRQRGANRSSFIFPAVEDPSQPFPMATLRKYVLAVRDETDVSFTLHDLRRGFATTAESLASMLTVKRLLNHRSVEGDVTAGYVIMDEKVLAGAMQRIADTIAGTLVKKQEAA
jgi:integrase